jgi:hypothetical protein
MKHTFFGLVLLFICGGGGVEAMPGTFPVFPTECSDLLLDHECVSYCACGWCNDTVSCYDVVDQPQISCNNFVTNHREKVCEDDMNGFWLACLGTLMICGWYCCALCILVHRLRA